jgi:predicted ferric reductase
MALMLRGIAWYGLYQFLVLLPLITAFVANPARRSPSLLIEVAVGAGFVGFSLMSLEFALISRIRPAAEPFGEDALQLLHKLMGQVALGFILAHPILLIVAGYPANCWLNPFSTCANTATRTALLAVLILLLLVGSSVWRKPLRIPYPVWQLFHGLLSLAVVFLALVHMFRLGRYTSTPVMQLVWVLYSVLVLLLIGRYKILIPLLNLGRPWEVVETREERGSSRTLVLRPVGHDGFAFEAGQFAWIRDGRTPFGLDQHPISFSSSGDVQPGGTIQFTIRDLGDWSGKTVPELKPGDRMWVDGPYGVFTTEHKQAMGYAFIGGGVGITPLYSMLQTMAEREDRRPVLLFYGSRDLESMTFREELETLAQSERLNLEFIPVLEEPPEDWPGESGYITAEILQKYLPVQFKRFKYLICGPIPMMDAMERVLPTLGVPEENVLTERFDMV